MNFTNFKNFMNFTNLFILFTGLILAGCTGNREQTLSEIEKLEKELYADSIKGINQAVAEEAINAYIDFANKYPDDEKAPEYLFRAGEVSMGIMKSTNALQYFQKICNDYPEHEKTPVCLFLQGFVYETQLNNKVMAQKTYSGFIEKYPNHTLTDDAKFSLDNIGKSDEEIIKQFEEKLSKEKSDKEKEEEVQ